MGCLDGEGVIPGSGKGVISSNLLECMIWYLRPSFRSVLVKAGLA